MSESTDSVGFDLPEPQPPTAAEIQELAELREDLTPADFAKFGDACGTELTYHMRRIWLQKRRSEHPEEERLAARSLTLRIKAMGWLEFCFRAVLWISTVGPNILRWALESSRTKTNWTTVVPAVVSIATAIGLQLIGFQILAILFFSLGVMIAALHFVGVRVLRNRFLDSKVESWIVSINESNSRLQTVCNQATIKLNDLLKRPEDHMNQSDLLPFESAAVGDIEASKARFKEVLERYSNNRWAERYIQQGLSIIKVYAQERAEALWKWERSRVSIDENAKAHRWSAAALATLIGGFTLALRITLVIVVTLSPLLYFALVNHPSLASPEIPAEIANELQKETFEWRLIKSLGLLLVLLAIAKLTATWVINFITRVAMRQLQFKKVFKKANQDQLDSDCTWQSTKIRLSKLLEAHLQAIVLTIDRRGLRNSELQLLDLFRQSSTEELERLKLQYAKLTGRPWLEPKKDEGEAMGAVFDSGAPGEIADSATQGFLESLFELI